MFRANRCSVESCVGRMIHRITLDTTSGDRVVDLRVERKVRTGLGVVWCRAMRCSVHSGMMGWRDGIMGVGGSTGLGDRRFKGFVLIVIYGKERS